MVETLALAKRANSVTARMFGEKTENELHSSTQEIHDLEKQSDELSFKLKEDIVEGAITPNVIDNLPNCAEILDEMIDAYYYVVRELKRMATSSPPRDGHAFEPDSAFQKSSERGRDQSLNETNEFPFRGRAFDAWCPALSRTLLRGRK
jgi:nucleotidyltransferase/DNA polymerase involved in DNA repair